MSSNVSDELRSQQDILDDWCQVSKVVLGCMARLLGDGQLKSTTLANVDNRILDNLSDVWTAASGLLQALAADKVVQGHPVEEVVRQLNIGFLNDGTSYRGPLRLDDED